MDLKNKLNEVQEKLDIIEENTKEFSPASLNKFEHLFEGDGECETKWQKEDNQHTLKDIINKFECLFEGNNAKVENISMNEVTEENGLDEKQENPHHENVDGKIYYYDDNGRLYRVENDLEANTQYEINSYKYHTDEHGRIKSAEGKLHIKEREGRLPIRDSIEEIGKGDQKEGDDRGHLIGDQFDGANGMENMIPQDANINRNDFKNFENELAREVKNEKEVYIKVEPNYEGDSRRPEAVLVSYSIDGEEGIRVFPNGQEE